MSGASPSAAPGTRRPRRRPGENRAGLIAAGTIEFGLRGYAGAQTSAIAERAGVSQPNVYANFASKHELFLACARHLVTSASAAQSDSIASERDPADSRTPAEASHGQLLLFQMLAASGEAALQPSLAELIAELRHILGEAGFHAQILGAASQLVEAHTA